MTNREKIKHLGQYKKLVVEYEHIVETYKVLLEKLNYPSPKVQVLSFTPSGEGCGNPIEAEYLRMFKLEALIEEIQKRLADIEEAINGLEDSTQRFVMRLRYIDGLSWEKICVKIAYEWAWTHRIHSSALARIRLGRG